MFIAIIHGSYLFTKLLLVVLGQEGSSLTFWLLLIYTPCEERPHRLHSSHLTRWDTDGATYTCGGTLNHILTSDMWHPVLVAMQHLLSSTTMSLSVHSSPYQPVLRFLTAAPKFPSFPSSAPRTSYTLPGFFPLVTFLLITCAIHMTFFGSYVVKPHIQCCPVAHTWMWGHRIVQTERVTVDTGLTSHIRSSVSVPENKG